ncbi:class I SAM-dependent methyltransferase [uncultured Tateyamaria sp.]|uniref:class I SAM-dependent methyltransferase n=1 Tax=uncultured Tateyamaria sp. TaxID=455651 RepID=UPI0026352DB1|nr:class I SAM-dependent methyltransferase [uncultured Tateyamaria sp.]
MKPDAKFWDRIAPKYALQAIDDVPAYELTLDRVRDHLAPDARVLEFGCGTGATALTLAPDAGSILAIDFSAGMIAQANARFGHDSVRFMQADVFHYDLSGMAFDVVMAFNVLHLIDDLDAVLARVHSLIPPGGLFISKTPCIGERSLGLKFSLIRLAIPLMQRFGKAPFVRFETISALDATLERAGFDIVETGNFPVRPPNHFVVAKRR